MGVGGGWGETGQGFGGGGLLPIFVYGARHTA